MASNAKLVHLCRLFGLIFLFSQVNLFGLIGETPEQCTARYGEPIKLESDSFKYKFKNRVIVIKFVEGRAASIHCSDANVAINQPPSLFREFSKFHTQSTYEDIAANPVNPSLGFKNFAHIPLDLLKFMWGTKEPSAFYLGMWSTHLTHPKDINNNWLIGLNIEGFFLGTFINSYDKRSWAAGVERRVWATGKKNGLNASVGYRLGLMTGYEERFTMFFGHSPVILFPEFISNLAYKNVGFQIGYSWTVFAGGFFWRF